MNIADIIKAKAQELYPAAFEDIIDDVYLFQQIDSKNFIKGATFGLSLQTNEWVSVKDRLPTKEDADKFNRVLWYYADKYSDVDDWNDVDTIAIASHWKSITPPNK